MSDLSNKGSVWEKWDLHLHSCYTWLNNNFNKKNGTPNVEEYVNKILDSGIKAIGLTNYFNFKDEDYELKKILEENGISVFLNLEFRLNQINKDSHLSDYHVLFDNELDNDYIKTFLSSLPVECGGDTKRAAQLNTEAEINSASVEFDTLLEKLRDKSAGLTGRYLTGCMTRGHGSSTSDNQPKNMTVYEKIIQNSDLIIHSSDSHKNIKNDRKFWLDHNKYIKPLIQSSDAHTHDQIGEKYSWIKSTLTFEGLKQIIFEPDSRVSLSKETPEVKSNYLIMDYLEIDNKKYDLNDSLNTVIGGRSTGKSTLINSIAKKLNNQNYLMNKEELHTFDSGLKILWKDEVEDYSREIDFFPQDYMSNLSFNKKELNNLIFEIIQSKNLEEAINRYDSQITLYEKEIEGLVTDYFDIKEKCRHLVKPEGDRDGIIKQLELLQKQEEEVRNQHNFSEEELSTYSIKNKKIIELNKDNKKINKVLNNYEKLEELNLLNTVDLEFLDDEYKDEIEDILSTIKQEVYKKWYISLEKFSKDLENKAESNKEEITEITSSKEFIIGAKLIKSNEELSNLKDNIDKESKKLEKIKVYEQQKQKLKVAMQNLEEKILAKFIGSKKIHEDLVANFFIKEIDLEIKIEFTKIKIDSKINYLDLRNGRNLEFISKFDSIDPLNKDNTYDVLSTMFKDLSLKFTQNKNIDTFIRDIFTTNWYEYGFEIYYQDDEFQKMSQGKKAFVILKLLLEFSENKRPVLIDQPEDSLDNRAIYHELTKYIREKKKERQIILVTHNPNIVVGADAENVIVANQHSNGTRNENDRKFDYINGPLEDTTGKNKNDYLLKSQGIKHHVFEILEGGQEAFRKREQKYNIDNL